MAVYFGSEVVAEEVYAVLAATGAVTAVVGSRILNLSVVPQDTDLPAALHYAEAGNYHGPVGQPSASEVVRYVIRFTCEGSSTDPIRAAAEAAFVAFDGHEATRAGTYLGFSVTGEWPLTTVLEGGVLYRQLGFFVDVYLAQGS
jgi:hypothetical protein